MKKAKTVILAVFIMFVCVISGFFIGRHTVGKELIVIDSNIASSFTEVENTGANKNGTSQTGKININTASADQLQMLPNVGKVLASRIIEYRTQFGPFSTVDDLVFVKGIGEKKLGELRQFITVGG